ncbi:MAG: ring-cleaving dioxygenase [Bacteroidia bacterium]|nr:ring-cleaving dioxygenase [Bacteroidia bacterium]
MNFPIRGIHHLTATVNDAQEDLDFYVKTLGLRLVKKTINFDNTGVYHFYYGNETGYPGTIMTTFPYKGKGVRTGVKGHGQVVQTTFSVPKGSISAWALRLKDEGIDFNEFERFGFAGLAFEDPSTLGIELVEAEDSRDPWLGGSIVDGSMAIRGIHSVSMIQAVPEPTVKMMTENLNFQVTAENGNRIRLEADTQGAGKIIDLVVDPKGDKGLNGIGTVHHVALAINNDEEHKALHEFIVSKGIRITDILDRNYFHSIYFREPGGVLFEVATIPPGFMVDESKDDLGLSLKLPQWEEDKRKDIEAGLPIISY